MLASDRVGSAGLKGAVLAAASLLALPARAEPAAWPAAPLDVRVSYAAPPGCPSGAEFLGVLQTFLAQGGEGGVDAVVRITGPHADGRFELRLALRVGEMLGETQERSESCAALMQLAALTASMTRTPTGATPAAYSPAEPLPPAAAPAPLVSPELDAPVTAPAASEKPAPPLAGFALAELRVAAGMLPGTALGRGLGVGVARGPWALRLSGTWWLPEELVFSGDGGSPIPLEFEQQSLELAPCVGHELSSRVRLEGCVSFGVFRTQTSAGEREVWGAVGGTALAVLRPWRGLRLEAAAQLQVPLAAPSYAVQALEDVYQASAVQPAARLALGWEFGGGAAPAAVPAPSFESRGEVHARRSP